MADHFDITIPECKNFITTARWLAYTGECLERYTRDGVRALHQRIYTRLAHLPLCVDRCSELHGRQWQHWCRTCREWRSQLLRARRLQNVSWEKTESWMWPAQYENIAKVFAPPSWTKGIPKFRDVSYLCSLWDNCWTHFRINRNIIKRLRDQRNDLKHHVQMRVSNEDKDKLFDVLEDLFNDPEVQLPVPVNDCVRHIRAVENEQYGDETVRNLVQNVVLVLHNQEDQSSAIKVLNEQIHDMHSNFKLMKGVLIMIGISAFLILTLYYTYHRQSPNVMDGNGRQRRLGGCLPDENYNYPFAQDFPQIEYISHHKELFGRQWLFEDIESSVLQTSTNSSGIILEADIGYGKTAIIYHLLCAQRSPKGKSIRQHIVSFHVCRFDVDSTKKGERFIRRLIGFFSTKSAEYGSIIAHLSNESIVHDRDKCGKELEACFDQGIVFPLSRLDTPTDSPWLIVIDALDECFDINMKENSIITILSRGIRKVPAWIKFIITSRKTRDLPKLKKLSIHVLEANDSRNVDDINMFIRERINDRTHINQTVDICRGNFQFATHLIIHLSRSNALRSIDSFPQTLNEIYEADFERVFPTHTSFEFAKHVFEIICATITPLTPSEVFTILQNQNKAEKDMFNLELQKLSFYIKVSNNRHLVFVHQSISEWLLSTESEKFKIHAENGHRAISSFMINSFNTSSQADIVELAIHVAEARNKTLTNVFTSVVQQYKSFNRNTLHRLVWRSSSVVALKLLLNNYKHVGALNSSNITPAFVAAAKGHLGQLKELRSRGANLSFVAGQDNVIFEHTESWDEIISLHNDVYYTGYNLLQVATKHGHLETVDYLLSLNKYSVHVQNAVGYRASDIACERGYLSILERIATIEGSILDRQCFYLASKYNHINILAYLVKKNISINCISDAESAQTVDTMVAPTSTRFIKVSLNGNIILSSNLSYLWVTVKETPLHVALSGGHYETFNLIVQKFPELLDCVDTYGYTPVLKSIVNNTTDVSNPYIRKRLLIDKCGNLSDQIDRLVHGETCPAGATSAHLIALYDRFEIALSILKYQLLIEWNTPDDNSMMAVHYASMKNHIRIFAVFDDKNVNLINTKTKNGLVAFHIAGRSGAYISFYVLTLHYTLDIPVLKDDEDRSVLHHIVLREFNGVFNYDKQSQSEQFSMFEHVVGKQNHNLYDVDVYNRNILHYVLKNGHVYAFQYLLERYAADTLSLLTVSDRFNQTPIAFALNREKDNIFIIPDNCNYFDIFDKHCNIDIEKYLRSWEYTLWLLIKSASSQHVKRFVIPHLDKIFKMSPYLTTAFVAYNRDVNKNMFQSYVLKSLPMSIHSLFAISRFRPDTLHECGKPLHESPLHLMALKYPVLLARSDMLQFFNLISGNPIRKGSLSCCDTSGYSILHYAIISRNPFLADILLDLSIHISTDDISLKDVVWMLLLNSPKHVDGHTLPFEVTMDDVLVKLLQRSRYALSKADICRNMSQELSIIHLLAVNGFVKTLQSIRNSYGNRVLSCMNSDSFTPLYFAKVFNHSATVVYLKGIATESLPKPFAEAQLLFNVDNDFPFSTSHIDLPSLNIVSLANKKAFQSSKNKSHPITVVDMFPDGKISQSNPLMCLKHKLKFRNERFYKQWRMLRCIKKVFKFCKSIPAFDALAFTLLKKQRITEMYEDTRAYMSIKSLINENLAYSKSRIRSFERNERLPMKNSNQKPIKIHKASKDAFSEIKELNMMYITKEFRIILHMLTSNEIFSIYSRAPLREKVVSLYLEILRDAAIQISIRVLHDWAGKKVFSKSDYFVGQRLLVLDLVFSLPEIKFPFGEEVLFENINSPQYRNYIKRVHQIGQTLHKYRYLNIIRVSQGYSKYRTLRMNHLLNIDAQTQGFQTVEEFFEFSNYFQDSLSKAAKLYQRKHGEKMDPFDNLKPNMV